MHGRLELVCLDERDIQHLHDAVEQAVHHLEPALLVAIDGTESPCVLGPADLVWRLHRNVRDLKNAEWQRVRAVFPQRLEQAGEEGCPDDLVLGGGGVLQPDGIVAGVFPVEGGEIVVVRALTG